MDLLERAVKEFETARAVAKILGVSEVQISMVRGGRRKLNERQVWKLARALGEDPVEHLMPLFAGQERDEEEKAYWMGEWNGLRKAKGAGKAGFAALIVAIMVGVLAPKGAEAEKRPNLMNSLDIRPLCHLSDTLKKLMNRASGLILLILKGKAGKWAGSVSQIETKVQYYMYRTCPSA